LGSLPAIGAKRGEEGSLTSSTDSKILARSAATRRRHRQRARPDNRRRCSGNQAVNNRAGGQRRWGDPGFPPPLQRRRRGGGPGHRGDDRTEKIAGPRPFLLVGDSKLISYTNAAAMNAEGVGFVAPLAASRVPAGLFAS